MGPWRQLKKMFSEKRIISTVLVVLFMVLTLLAALLWHKTMLAIIFCILQFLAFIWYSISYIPYAQDTVSKAVMSCVWMEQPDCHHNHRFIHSLHLQTSHRIIQIIFHYWWSTWISCLFLLLIYFTLLYGLQSSLRNTNYMPSFYIWSRYRFSLLASKLKGKLPLALMIGDREKACHLCVVQSSLYPSSRRHSFDCLW